MVNIDIERAKDLLGSARVLFGSGDFSGVAGLAYQAFESATMALLSAKNGDDRRSHAARRERAKVLMEWEDATIDRLWTLRNIDFYGNSAIGETKREITEEEAEDCLEKVEGLIAEIEDLLG